MILGIAELIVISEAPREQKEVVDIRDVQVMMALEGELGMLAFRGQEEDEDGQG